MVYGQVVEPKIGSYVKPDGWTWGSRLTVETWEAADFRLPLNSDGPIKSLAVKVKVTGRTWQRRNGDYFVRVQVEFVGDGEPSTFSPGWMKRD